MPLHPPRVAACVLAALSALPAAARAQCSAWPGEPDPLPQVGSADGFAAGWARFRREELRGLALLLEGSDGVEARRVWLHAACLAPGDSEIAAALARTARPAVHRVTVSPGAPEARMRRATVGAAFDVLSADARVTPSSPGPGPATASSAVLDLSAIDAQIADAATHLGAARFQAAADLSDLARARLLHLAEAPPVRERRVRVELLGATARLALGREEDARTCIQRALREDPDLVADPAVSPPKLLRLVSQERERRAENSR